MRKYLLKTNSLDPRPVVHSVNWVVVGTGFDKKLFYAIAIWIKKGEDVYDFYPEAYDVSVAVDSGFPEIKRGAGIEIHIELKSLPRQSNFYSAMGVNSVLLGLIERLITNGEGPASIAKKLGVNYNRFKKMMLEPSVKLAMSGGYKKMWTKIAGKL